MKAHEIKEGMTIGYNGITFTATEDATRYFVDIDGPCDSVSFTYTSETIGSGTADIPSLAIVTLA